MDKKVSVRNLQIGMFVAQLDRPWSGTPFPVQGFFIRNLDTLLTVRQFCDTVLVRTDKSGRPTAMVDRGATNWCDRSATVNPDPSLLDFVPRKPVEYSDTALVEDELIRASNARRRLRKAMNDFTSDINSADGLTLDQLSNAMDELTASVLRNPDAAMWLRLIKDCHSYTESHALDTAALAITLGRHLGHKRDDLVELGLAAVLVDVGKCRIPEEILNRGGQLKPSERIFLRKHVELGLEIMESVAGVPPSILEAIAAHHERFDGSGYPRGLGGRNIPPFARIIAVADSFDAMTSDRAYAQGMSPHDAMGQLYESCGSAFQRDVVEQFIKSLGIYPTGTLIELGDASLALVLGQNRTRKLLPRVMLIREQDGTLLKSWPTVDLAQRGTDVSSHRLVIKRAVEPESYGLNLRELYTDRTRAEALFGLRDPL